MGQPRQAKVLHQWLLHILGAARRAMAHHLAFRPSPLCARAGGRTSRGRCHQCVASAPSAAGLRLADSVDAGGGFIAPRPGPTARHTTRVSSSRRVAPRAPQGVTTVLFPLSVVKTRQMADHTLSGGFSVRELTHARHRRHLTADAPLGCPAAQQVHAPCTHRARIVPQGMKQTVTSIWKAEGVPGFYRGFATVIFGTIPARMVSGRPGAPWQPAPPRQELTSAAARPHVVGRAAATTQPSARLPWPPPHRTRRFTSLR